MTYRTSDAHKPQTQKDIKYSQSERITISYEDYESYHKW